MLPGTAPWPYWIFPHLSGLGPTNALRKVGGERGERERWGKRAEVKAVLAGRRKTRVGRRYSNGARFRGGGDERSDGSGQRPPSLHSSLCLGERGTLCTGGRTGQQRPGESFVVKPAGHSVRDLASMRLSTLDDIQALV